MTRQPTRCEVLLTRGAEQDLEALYDYIAEHDSVTAANHVLDQPMRVVEGLAQVPERGNHPKELLALGIKDFLQTAFKPHRVIYRVSDHRVVIHLIVDGRRDIQSVLARRLLGG